MRVLINWDTFYRYTAAVSFGLHTFRVFPRSEHHLQTLKCDFQTNAGVFVGWRRDIFDNLVASCFYPEKGELLEARLHIELNVEERDPFGFVLSPYAEQFPFCYTPEEQHALSPFTLQGSPVDLPFYQPSPANTVNALSSLNSALFKNIRYERREEGEAFSPEETLARGSGSCRDFAVLMAQILRQNGVATRLVSGYALGGEGARSGGAFHAWVEAYLPGAGWIGLDPTNGIWCNHHHIVTAVGLTPEDIAPVSGNYFGPTPVPSTMDATLTIEAVDGSQEQGTAL